MQVRELLIPRDTSPDAARVWYEWMEKRSPAERLHLMFEADQEYVAFVEIGVRQRHPDYSDQQVQFALRRIRLGETLFRLAYPNVEIEP